MLQWRSEFDLLIPGRAPSGLRNLSTKRGGWLSRGLHLRISDDRITARYNEASRNSVAPTMKGRLVPDANGTRVLGRIRWTGLVLAPFAWGALTIESAVLCIQGIAGEDPVPAIIFGLMALGFAPLTVLEVRTQDASRAAEESRLRSELLTTFGRGHH